MIIEARENGDLGGSSGGGKKWRNSDRQHQEDLLIDCIQNRRGRGPQWWLEQLGRVKFPLSEIETMVYGVNFFLG